MQNTFGLTRFCVRRWWLAAILALVASVSASAQASWTLRNTGTTANLWGVACDTSMPTGGAAVVAVGEGGTILTSADDGETWTPRTSGTTAWLTAVCYDYRSRRFFAVGDGGIILSSADGIAWTNEPSPTTRRLNTVGASSDGSLYALGEAGTGLLVRDENGVWTRTDVGFGDRWMRGLSGGYAFGETGAVFQPSSGGGSAAPWQLVPVPTSADLESVVSGGKSGEFGGATVAVGAKGVILMNSFSSPDWMVRDSGTTQRLRGVCWKVGSGLTLITLTVHVSFGEYFAVGSGGAIVRSNDAFTWRPDASPTTRNLNAVAPAARHVVAVGDGGTILQIGGSEAVPKITQQPVSGTDSTGRAYLEAGATGSGAPTYLWLWPGSAPWPAGTDYPRQFLADMPAHPGSVNNTAYRLLVANAFGQVLSDWVTPNRFLNLAGRAVVGAGENALIGGFAVRGFGAPRTVLIRAAGPALAGFGVANALRAPRLSVFDHAGQVIATNAGWESVENLAELRTATQAAGTFPLAAASADAAVLLHLGPGNYTAQVTGADGANGVALIEVYDVDRPDLSRLANLSVRARVQTGERVLIGGIVIDGGVKKRVLVRAAGPALAAFGLPGALAQPKLMLLRGNSVVATAAAWNAQANAPEIRSLAKSVDAFAFAEGSADAAMVLELEPGAYTAQVTGLDGTEGVALVEVYEL